MTRRDRQRRALVTLDDRLVAFEEELRDARRVPGLPPPVREALDELLLDVARLQAITEAVAEGWVQCVEPTRPEPQGPLL